MIETFRQVLEQSVARLSAQATTFLPSLFVAIVVFGVAWVVALLVRWLLLHAFKGERVDAFLRRTGIGTMLDHSGRLRASPLVAHGLYYAILLVGLLNAISVFDTDITREIVDGVVHLLPKLFAAGAIILAGIWLAQYLGRGALVWASNEGFPWARRFCAFVRVWVVFVSVVVAADMLNFARTVFFSAFLIFAIGTVFAACLVLALNHREVYRWFSSRGSRPEEDTERSLWHHL
ncbi:MAG: mechanosensitive ion channel family protein [Bryobacteraceae bacterium]